MSASHLMLRHSWPMSACMCCSSVVRLEAVSHDRRAEEGKHLLSQQLLACCKGFQAENFSKGKLHLLDEGGLELQEPVPWTRAEIEVDRFGKETRRPSTADTELDGQTRKAPKSEAYVTTSIGGRAVSSIYSRVPFIGSFLGDEDPQILPIIGKFLMSSDDSTKSAHLRFLW